jgi:hypothetical protein
VRISYSKRLHDGEARRLRIAKTVEQRPERRPYLLVKNQAQEKSSLTVDGNGRWPDKRKGVTCISICWDEVVSVQ